MITDQNQQYFDLMSLTVICVAKSRFVVLYARQKSDIGDFYALKKQHRNHF